MTDYLTFWKVDTAVFLRPISPASLYLPDSRRESLERLRLLATHEPRTLLVITGEAGSGKSTLLRWLSDTLSLATHEMLTLSLVQEEVESGWLAPRLADMLGTAFVSGDAVQNLAEVTRRLDELVENKRHILIAIDSAHLIRTPKALSEILGILNIQALSIPCLTFVLSGEPDLLGTMALAGGMDQKIALHMRLARLTLQETTAYLEHRLRLAGLQSPFEEAAIEAIYQRSQGSMLGIDIFAEHCLIEAAQTQTKRITAKVAHAAARYLSQLQDPANVASHKDTSEITLDSWDISTSAEKQLFIGLDRPGSAEAGHPPAGASHLASDHTSKGSDLPAPPPAENSPADLTASESSPPIPPPPKGAAKNMDESSASIRLSSLFKSMPSRPKPKGS